MTSLMSKVERISMLLFVFTYGLLLAHAHTVNDVLASEHSHSFSSVYEPSDGAIGMSSAQASAVDLSSGVASSADSKDDPPYVPPDDSTDESSVSSSSVISSADLSEVYEKPSQSVDDPPYVKPDGVDQLSSASSISSSSVVDLSEVDELSQVNVDDLPYVPPDSVDQLSSGTSSLSSLLSTVEIEEPSEVDVDDPPYVSSHDGYQMSSSSSVSSSSSLSPKMDLSAVDEPSRVHVDDPPYVPPSDNDSSSSSASSSSDGTLQPVEIKLATGAGTRRREPASLDPSGSPGKMNPDNAKRKPGRPPAVFNGPGQESWSTSGDGHGKRLIPGKDNDDAESAGRKPTRGGGKPAPEFSKGTPSKRPNKHWGGPPSPQRLKELKEADTKYFDLYLCGQFLLGSTVGSSDDFAVAGFNYAGRTQPFSPCSELGTTAETVNYIHRTARADAPAFQQVVDDLPATWRRYTAENGRPPRVVHVFTANLPTEVSSLLRLRSLEPYRSARFVLGYLNQPILEESASNREFLDLLGELDRDRIEKVRVCGRCAKVSSYSAEGRRRSDMQYGMSIVPETSTNVDCRPLQEHAIPGAQFTSYACDSFQKSVVRCTLRAIQRRCQGVDTKIDSREVDIDEALLDAVNGLTRVCGVDGECWRREGESILERIVTKSKVNRCNMPRVAAGKMLGRCAEGAAGLPFDV